MEYLTMHRIDRFMSALLVVGVGAACATDAGTAPAAGTGEVTVTLARTNTVAAAVLAVVADETAAPLDLANVSSLVVEILAVQVRRAAPEAEEGEPETDDEGEWIALELETPALLDLLAVPEEGDDPPLVIASGVLEAGDYTGLRLIVGTATVTFIEPFTVGQSLFEGEHAVTVPSGAQTGLKAQVAFTVTGDEDVDVVGILFDQGATLGNAVATGSGTVILTPVLK
jgi:hypothetical protein